MLPFQPNGGLSTAEGYQIRDDLILNHASMESNLISFGNEWRRSEVTNFESSSQQRQTESKNDRKVVHREVEKKRRQEMSSLHASLGSLLPLGQIKGKRSVGDQIEEAVNYIKQKVNNIEKLKIRRNELMKWLSSSDPKLSTSRASDGFVTVNMAVDGLEILINGRSDLGLSRLLAVLLQRGLDVVSCVSTRTNDRFLLKIKVEAIDMRNLDVSELQDRLSDSIK